MINHSSKLFDGRIVTCNDAKENNCICSVTDLYPSSLCQFKNEKNCHCGTKSILLGVVTKDKYENLFTNREAHEESINKVISLYEDYYYASCSYDKTIKIWKDTKLFSVLVGNTMSVYSIIYIQYNYFSRRRMFL